jgi:hypothetical protein
VPPAPNLHRDPPLRVVGGPFSCSGIGIAQEEGNVNAVVLFAVPLAEGEHYLSLVLTFSSLLKDEMAFAALPRCTHGEEMWSVLQQVRCIRTGPRELPHAS